VEGEEIVVEPAPLDRFRQVGNAAGIGAKQALISRGKRAEARALAQQVAYIELAAVPDLVRIFARAVSLEPSRSVGMSR
jgi:uncharacterized 2Fe-2S/4Fe-4S cluster protein (DUF4445 family)